jgi:hypothetical protein
VSTGGLKAWLLAGGGLRHSGGLNRAEDAVGDGTPRPDRQARQISHLADGPIERGELRIDKVAKRAPQGLFGSTDATPGGVSMG